ncbi:MAG: hypothetical protein Q8O83_01765 [bacterium]|nr:hypothetical protein [bacterium]
MQKILVEELSISEILMGLLMNLGGYSFDEQALYNFFAMTDDRIRYGIKKRSNGDFYSEAIRDSLTFFEMGQFFESWGDMYLVHKQIPASISKELTERGVLPKYESFFKNLANQFIHTL